MATTVEQLVDFSPEILEVEAEEQAELIEVDPGQEAELIEVESPGGSSFYTLFAEHLAIVGGTPSSPQTQVSSFNGGSPGSVFSIAPNFKNSIGKKVGTPANFASLQHGGEFVGLSELAKALIPIDFSSDDSLGIAEGFAHTIFIPSSLLEQEVDCVDSSVCQLLQTIQDVDETQSEFQEGTLTDVEADSGDYLRLGWGLEDSHEDGDISEYSKTGGTWNIEDTGARTGSYAVSGRSGNFGGDGSNIFDALYRGNYSPSQYIEQWHYFPDTSTNYNMGIAFAVSSGPSFYYLRYDAGNGYFELWKNESGSRSEIVGSSPGSYSGWLKMTIDWQSNGDMTATLYDSELTQLSQISGNDTTFGSGGIGMLVAQGVDDGADARFDDLKIRATSGNRLSPQLDLSSLGTVDDTLIEWTETLNGQTITIETRVSLDGGSTWTAWATATNGGTIPDLSSGTDVSNGLLECRETLSTSDATTTPQLNYHKVKISGLA